MNFCGVNKLVTGNSTLVRTLLFFVLIYSMNSCAEKQNSNFLIGSWKLRDVVNNTGQNVSDKMTFFENDSISIEILQDGKVIEQYSGKFQLDTVRNELTAIYRDSIATTFQIELLSESELELYNPNTKRVDRYLKY